MTVLNFLRDYWREILAVISVIATLILWLVKKKPTVNELDNILLSVLEKLPSLINAVECCKGSEAKKALVIEAILKYVKDQFSVDLPDSFVPLIDSYIESILSTPQKKEVIK